jgi:hypothetical protein
MSLVVDSGRLIGTGNGHGLAQRTSFAIGYPLMTQLIKIASLDSFSKDDIRELRNMREHIVEYFQGSGHEMDRWKALDASGGIGTTIGGRLDWVKFSEAAKRLLPALLSEPIPVVPFTFP